MEGYKNQGHERKSPKASQQSYGVFLCETLPENLAYVVCYH